MNTKSKTSILLVILLSLSMVACSTSQIVTDIDIAVVAVSVAAPVVAAFGGPGAQVISTYLTAAASGLNCALAAAQAPGATTASISAAIATCLASVVVPVLPSGTPQNIINVINAVAAGIATILKNYGGKKLSVSQTIKFSFNDHRKISSMRKELDKAIQVLNAK